MTKAELVKSFVDTLENARVELPEGMGFHASPNYWEKHPEGYVLDDYFDPLSGESAATVECRLACFDAITVKQMRDTDIAEGAAWEQLWAMWGCAGILQQPPRVITQGRKSYLRLRHNVYVSCDKGAGFVVSKDLSGRSACSTSDLDMKQAARLCKLLRKHPATCHALFYSYLAQALAEFSEFSALLKYNPAILGDYLKAVEEEYPNGNPMPNSKKVRPYQVPRFVSNKKVGPTTKFTDLVCADGVFARFSFGTSRVSLRLHQVDGEHIYSLDFPGWEAHEDWAWESYDGEDLTRESYTAFMQYRAAVLLLALSGVEFNGAMFFTRKAKRLKYCVAMKTVPRVHSILELKAKLLG